MGAVVVGVWVVVRLDNLQEGSQLGCIQVQIVDQSSSLEHPEAQSGQRMPLQPQK